MKKTIKDKKVLIIAGLLILLAIGCVFAYFQSTYNIDNKFKCAEAKVYLNEKFDPNDKWVPGEEKQKEVRFGNEGKIAAVLRVKFEPVLERADGTEDAEAAKDFSLNFTDDFDKTWVRNGEWYYYKKVLDPDDLTEVTLKSVTISDKIGNDEHGISADYTGAKYHVNIKSELLQASQAAEAAAAMKWDRIPMVSGKTVTWN